MRTLLRFSFFLAAMSLWLAGPVAASHMQGGDLTYTSLGSNRYLVTLHVYRDCSGITLSPFTLECRSGGCNTSATISAPMVQVGSPVVGRQYCATLTGVLHGHRPHQYRSLHLHGYRHAPTGRQMDAEHLAKRPAYYNQHLEPRRFIF